MVAKEISPMKIVTAKARQLVIMRMEKKRTKKMEMIAKVVMNLVRLERTRKMAS